MSITNLAPATLTTADSYEYTTDGIEYQQQPLQTYSTNVSPTTKYNETSGRTSQQSRRGSLLYERRPSQQSIITQPIESTITTLHNENVDDKYAKENYENEKPKSTRSSPLGIDEQQPQITLRRKSSIRFYDEIPSNTIQSTNIEPTTATLNDSLQYEQNQYDYEKSITEYSQPIREQVYTQPYEQSRAIYTTGNYDQQQYTVAADPQYDTRQYRSGSQQSNYVVDDQYYQNAYRAGYQSGYEPQNYEQKPYQSETISSSIPQTEQLLQYQTISRNESNQEQQQQQQQLQQEIQQPKQLQQSEAQQPKQLQQQSSITESITSNSNLGTKYKGNGNTSTAAQQQYRQQPVSKQPPKKKFT